MILVAGEALVDLVIHPDGRVEAALGGAPFNAARAAARLGADVEFAGVLSRDRFGTLLTQQLVADGVGIGHAARTDAPTTLAAAELDDGGSAEYRFYITGTSAPALTTIEFDREPLVFFTGALGLVMEPMATTLATAIERAPADAIVMIDVNCRPKVIDDRDAYVDRLSAMVSRADIVKVSDEDLAYLSPGQSPIAAAEALLGHGAGSVLVTAGSQPTIVLTADGRTEVPVPRLTTSIIDTIGAGDTFAGGLLAWWVDAGLDRSAIALDALEHAVHAAHAAAAVVVTRRGADPPRRDEMSADWAARS